MHVLELPPIFSFAAYLKVPLMVSLQRSITPLSQASLQPSEAPKNGHNPTYFDHQNAPTHLLD